LNWIAFIKSGKIPERESFIKKGKITLYENTEATLIDFPQREIIEKIEGGGVFTKILNSFLRGRDENFIA
jgi:hypothetical protein